MSSAPAIGFEYRPSRSLPAATLVMTVLAMLAIALCALPLMAKLTAFAVVAAATGMTLRRLSRNPVQAVGCGLGGTGAGDDDVNGDGAWNLRLRDVGNVPATLASWRVIGGFVLLCLRTSTHGVHTVLLGTDNADADLRRRLRMRLAVQHGGEGTRDS